MAESTPWKILKQVKMKNRFASLKRRFWMDTVEKKSMKPLKNPLIIKALFLQTKALLMWILQILYNSMLWRKVQKETTEETLKWVHIAISNAKRNLLGNYHKIKRKYLQLYLNEFIYKLNRRYFGDRLFERLIIANITGL